MLSCTYVVISPWRLFFFGKPWAVPLWRAVGWGLVFCGNFTGTFGGFLCVFFSSTTSSTSSTSNSSFTFSSSSSFSCWIFVFARSVFLFSGFFVVCSIFIFVLWMVYLSLRARIVIWRAHRVLMFSGFGFTFSLLANI